MELMNFLLLLGGVVLGGGVGFLLKKGRLDEEKRKIENENQKLKLHAEEKANQILFAAKNEALKMQEEVRREDARKRAEYNKMEQRLLSKEQQLDNRLTEADKNKEELEKKLEQIRVLKEESKKVYDEQNIKLQNIASLSKEEARTILLKKVEEEAKEDILVTIKKAEKEVTDEADEKAKFLIAEAICKYAADTVMESTVTTIALPNDEMKGRIIGREGRNINAFEQVTGVDVIVDETPGTVAISSFDLLRRYIAKISLEKLISDGRIHPARIEEVVQKAKEEVNVLIKDLGEQATYDTGVAGLHPDLIKFLGRLKFRISFGQNVLKHSMEVSFIAAALASELGADVEVCKKAGLLHDIGKAVDHEIQGHHSLIGKDILKKYGFSEAVIHAVEAHHDLVEARTLEAKLVKAANLIANARPGANKENMDNFIKRMTELENLVKTFDGVVKCFAIQTGKGVRIFVDPKKIDDLAASKLAKEIVNKIEKDLKYPGQIKVEIMRELRAESFAK